MNKYICIHSHFYQPPRENPWLDRIEKQDSAAPFHDWNERISSECYRENGRSKIVNGRNYVEGFSNNYSKMSFNFGPTLLSWLENFDVRTYDYIIKGDMESVKHFNGHGNAIAQCYNHIIMPLANKRDKETQIVWGIKDFEKRFNRYPEAMWLPETAVDIETLELLAQYKMKYVILAPRQAAKVRKLGSLEWIDVSQENIDTKIPYLIKLPSGAEIAAFFYNGAISKAIAFDGLLHNGDVLANRILSGFANDDKNKQLTHIATDGESYGHHHKYGDMALAYALKKVEGLDNVKLCNYAYFLELQPPTHEAQIFENSSWSCAHGIERWRSDCGCNSGGGSHWNQKWRQPLRKTLDELRDQVNSKFVNEIVRFKIDPWEVRNDYITAVLNRNEESNKNFIKKWIPDFKNHNDQVIFIKCFELQRQLQLMYTSCAWFFDESSGIETVQVLQYALRAAELAEELWGNFVRDQFLTNLKTIPSNLALYKNAFGIYEQVVKNCEIGFFTIAAHYAVASLFKDPELTTRLYCYDIKKDDLERIKIGSNSFVCGHAEFTSRNTYSKKHIMFAAVHFGENILSAGVSLLNTDEKDAEKQNEEYKNFKEKLTQKIMEADLTSYMQEFYHKFDKNVFTLKNFIPADRNDLIKETLSKKMDRIAAQYHRVYQDNHILVSFLGSLNMEIPEQLKFSFEYVVSKMIVQIFNEKIENLNIVELNRYAEEATKCRLDLKSIEKEMFFQNRLTHFAETIASVTYNQQVLEKFLYVITFSKKIIPNMSLSEIQFIIYHWKQGLKNIPREHLETLNKIFDELKIEQH